MPAKLADRGKYKQLAIDPTSPAYKVIKNPIRSLLDRTTLGNFRKNMVNDDVEMIDNGYV